MITVMLTHHELVLARVALMLRMGKLNKQIAECLQSGVDYDFCRAVDCAESYNENRDLLIMLGKERERQTR